MAFRGRVKRPFWAGFAAYFALVTGTVGGVPAASGAQSSPVLAIHDVDLTESTSSVAVATFTVSLSAPSSQTVSVRAETYSIPQTPGVFDEATPRSDYEPLTKTVTFASGVVSRPVAVRVVGDDWDEFREQFGVRLSNPVGATIGDAEGVATIQNDDFIQVQALDRAVVEGKRGRISNALVTVTLTRPRSYDLWVRICTEAGTATPGEDYEHIDMANVYVSPGVVSTTFAVKVYGDAAVEDNETFQIIAGDDCGWTEDRATIVISNDD